MSDHGPKRRRMRETARVSLNALARQMGISAPYLLDLERGYRRWSAAILDRHTVALAEMSSKNPTLAKG